MINLLVKLIGLILWPFKVVASSALKVVGMILGLAIVALVVWYVVTHVIGN